MNSDDCHSYRCLTPRHVMSCRWLLQITIICWRSLRPFFTFHTVGHIVTIVARGQLCSIIIEFHTGKPLSCAQQPLARTMRTPAGRVDQTEVTNTKHNPWASQPGAHSPFPLCHAPVSRESLPLENRKRPSPPQQTLRAMGRAD